jgi:nucleosome assembly protein 1-like 1
MTEELQQQFQADFEIGDLLKDQVIANAVDWFTGKALEEFQNFEDEDDEEFEDGIFYFIFRRR